MTRRGFLSSLAALPIATALSLRMPARPQGERPQLEIKRLPDLAELRGHDHGISIRYVRKFDATLLHPPRFDVLYGVATLRPTLSMRVAS